MSETRDHILHLLKSTGPQETGKIASMLKMSVVGARQHLNQLVGEGLLAADDVAGQVGRPRKVWRLTDEARSKFPDGHEALTVEMIESIRALFGDAGLDQMIRLREEKVRGRYAQDLAALSAPGARVKRLAKLRDQEGYMAVAERTGKNEWLLLENHCPICVAAAHCQGFCRSELQTFQQVLGPDVSVEREEHILRGARRCAYRVRTNQT